MPIVQGTFSYSFFDLTKKRTFWASSFLLFHVPFFICMLLNLCFIFIIRSNWFLSLGIFQELFHDKKIKSHFSLNGLEEGLTTASIFFLKKVFLLAFFLNFDNRFSIFQLISLNIKISSMQFWLLSKLYKFEHIIPSHLFSITFLLKRQTSIQSKN